jgi:DNA-binding MarR family transcriptional regulator
MTEGGPSVEEFTNVAEFRAALRRFLRRSERVARQSGLTPQRQLLLLMIKGAPDGSEQSTVTELAERLQLAQSTVTELVRRAEQVGFIERQQSTADGRVAHLRLTPEGERRLLACFTDLEAERRQLRDAFSSFDGRVDGRSEGLSGGLLGVPAELGDP